MEQKTRQWKRTRKMVIPMDEVEYDRLMDLANRTGLSMSECVRRAVSRVEPDVVAMSDRELAGVRESRPEALPVPPEPSALAQAYVQAMVAHDKDPGDRAKYYEAWNAAVAWAEELEEMGMLKRVDSLRYPNEPQTFASLHDDTAGPVDNERSAVEKCPEAVDN